MSEFEENLMGKQSYDAILQEYGNKIIPPNHPTAQFVRRVAGNIIKVSGMSDVEWEVHLIDDPETNAFVIPGGKIFVFTGILSVVQNEDGLAAVLGHEIAHTIARHSAEKMSTMKFILLGRILLSVVFDAGVFGKILTDVGLMKPFSRLCESEADYIGLQLMAQACYNPDSAIDMWKRMKALDHGHTRSQYLSTHPSHENRIQKITEWLPEARGVRENADCKHLAPLWSGVVMQISERETQTSLKRNLTTNKDLVRSLVVHIVFALRIILEPSGAASNLTETNTERVPLPRLVSILDSAAVLAWDSNQCNTTNSNVTPAGNPNTNGMEVLTESKTKEKVKKDKDPEKTKLLLLLRHTAAFATMASMPQSAPRAKVLRRMLRSKILKHLFLQNHQKWHYAIRFKGRQHPAVDGSPYNDSLAFVRFLPDFNAFELISVLPDMLHPENEQDDGAESEEEEELGADDEDEDAEESLREHKNTQEEEIKTVQEQLIKIKKYNLALLFHKSNIVNLTVSYCIANSDSKTLKTFPVFSLARQIRRLFYTTYIRNDPSVLNSITELPHFNLGILPTDPEFDIHSTITLVSEEEAARQNSIRKRKWPPLWHAWHTARSFLSKQGFNRLINSQYCCLKVQQPDSTEPQFYSLSTIEDNSIRGYPWMVVCQCVDSQKDLEVCQSLYTEKILPILAIVSKMISKSDVTLTDFFIAKNINIATKQGESSNIEFLLNQCNINFLLLELNDKITDSLEKRILYLLKDEKRNYATRRNLVQKALAEQRFREQQVSENEKSDFDGGGEDFAKIRQSFVKIDTTIEVFEGFADDYTAHLFGSSVTTLSSETSDCDITILLKDPFENPIFHPISNMYLLAHILRHKNMQKVYAVATAKVPIVKFYDPEFNLNVDVNVGNALGIENSRLIREYLELDVRIRDVIIIIKYWAKMRNLNDSAEGGTFSSYALTLMVINFMQILCHIPSLQALYPSTEPRGYIITRANAVVIKSAKMKNDAKANAAIAFNEYKQRIAATKNAASSSFVASGSNIGAVKVTAEIPPVEDSIDSATNTAKTSTSHVSTPAVAIADKFSQMSFEESIKAGKSLVAIYTEPEMQLHEGLVQWDVSFIPSTHAILKTLVQFGKKANEFTSSKQYFSSVMYIVHGFFEHYGYVHQYNSGNIVSVRCGGVIVKRSAHPKLNVSRRGGGEKMVLVVEDPFQLDRNTTGMVVDLIPVINEFRRAAGLLTAHLTNSASADYVGGLEKLFAPFKIGQH
ncbi:hypothetical protein HK100_012706 [Physocladia obscura]|uniref:Polynucleotide adenylyltransferase n=1 Tax=Physocladia obscura TaxID=109957 RepID=A0AAD5XG24_9FUNG|nr:hypothetical protein HK100_012706 [Physocladia obscura]